MTRTLAITMIVITAFAAGCGSQTARQAEYRTLGQDPNRDTETARRENGRAIELIGKGNLDEAEKALKAALTADTFFGPAHNNLGVVYQKREQYYLAAWEFQYALRLMPFSPEPRNNLGLVYESVGRLSEAESWFDKALAIQPDNPELIGNLARLRVRTGQSDEKTRRLLEDLALKETRPDWAAWARERLVMMHGQEPAAGETGAVQPSQPQVPPPGKEDLTPESDEKLD